MCNTIIEELRKNAVDKLFRTRVFSNSFFSWQPAIRNLMPARTARQVLDLGDHLAEIFRITRTGERGQGDVSGGGAAWEALVCWYLNLCLIGHRTVVIKQSRALIPDSVREAMTVNYHNFRSNTESDLVAITFPNRLEYTGDKNRINILDSNRVQVPVHTGRNRRYNLLPLLNALTERDFSELGIHIIQCKTNWNDNSQIPMLWDMIYSANTFRTNVSVGTNGYSIANVSNFTYSFVTVPTTDVDNITSESTCVKRVTNLTGGNYWGRGTQNHVANSIKEMLQRNLGRGHQDNHLTTLREELPHLSTRYSYFGIN